MRSLPKKWGVEGVLGSAGEKGGFYWQPVSIIGNYAGVNEMSGAIALPPAPPGTWATAWALVQSAGTYLLQAANPVNDWPRFRPSKQYGQNGELNGINITSQCSWGMQESMEILALPYNSLPVSVARPGDFMGMPTGAMNWTFTVMVVGVIYIRGSFDSYTYT